MVSFATVLRKFFDDFSFTVPICMFYDILAFFKDISHIFDDILPVFSDILLFSLIVLFVISFIQEKGISLHKWFQQQHLIIRWCIYIFVISSIWVMGTYGFGFNAQDFIYGGF